MIRPDQVVVFAKDGSTGVSCDVDGARFADASEGTCAIFDSAADARAFCEAAVLRHPPVQYDIFDATGRSRPPLLTVVHPAKAASRDAHPRSQRRRQVMAWVLIAIGVPVMVSAYGLHDGGDQVFVGFLGVSMVIGAGRLLWYNLALRETERAREARLARADNGHSPAA